MKFVQFFVPNGRQEVIEAPTPADVDAFAEELSAVGWRFEIECLSTGQVHADCCDGEGQLAVCVTANDPSAADTIENMVREAHARWVKLGKPKADSGVFNREEAAE